MTGTIYENNSLLFATATLVTFGLVCMHQTHLNVNQVSIVKLELESGFSGQIVRWKLRMKNRAPITSFSINIRDAVIDVPMGENIIENIPVLLRKRGLVKLTELKISSTYPFGLFYAWKWWKGSLTFFVYPPLLPAARIPEPDTSTQTDLSGHEDFIGHREFVPGDSAHHIDWKVQARKQKKMVKLFDTRDPEAIELNWDSIPGNDLEERLSFLSTAVQECYNLQRPFSLVLPNIRFQPNCTQSHYQACLKALALFEGHHERIA